MPRRTPADVTWEDCGCPLSLRRLKSHVINLTPNPHMCLIGKEESRKHYIFDRHAYNRAHQAPESSTLGQWVAKRCQEERLFVAMPPVRPPLPPEPWRYDEPSKFPDQLKPGWRTWEPKDDSLNFVIFPVHMYDRMLDDFFDLLHIEGAMKAGKMESAEAWILSCGESGRTVRNKACLKIDRCFVTADIEFFAVMMATFESPNQLSALNAMLAELELGVKMSYMRRLIDVRIDANVRTGGCGHVCNP